MSDGVFHLQVLRRISALIGEVEKPVTMFVTSQHWGAIANEIVTLHKDDLRDPTNLPTPWNFKELKIGNNLLVVNSGSEDQGAVNLANRLEAERTNFAYRRDNFRIG
jgi:hypothetical protein